MRKLLTLTLILSVPAHAHSLSDLELVGMVAAEMERPVVRMQGPTRRRGRYAIGEPRS